MPGAVGRLFVEITGTDAPLQASLAKARASTDAFATKSGQSMSGFSRAANVAFVAAGAAAVAFAVISVKAYEQHQAVLVKLQAAMAASPKLAGASTQAFEEQAMSLEHLTGVEHDHILAADATLAYFQLTQKQILQVTPLVLDYARATGMDAETAATALGRALLGNARALKSIGISFKASGDTAKDFNTILSLLQARVGGLAAAYGKTLPGQIDIFKASLRDVEEVAGKALLPTASALVGVFTSLLHVLAPVAAYLPQILLGLLAYKALTFLPVLLGSIGAAFGLLGEAVGAGAVGAALTGTAAGLYGIATGAAQALPILALLGGTIYLLAKGSTSYDASTQAAIKTVAEFGTTTDAAKKAAEQLNMQYGHNKSSLDGLTPAFKSAIAAHKALVSSQGQLASSLGLTDTELKGFVDQSEAATLAANKQKEAILTLIAANLQLAGGFLGIKGAELSARGAQLSLIQAQQTYAKDVKDGHKNTLQGKQDFLALQQAQLGTVTSQEALTASIVDFADKQLKAGSTTDSIIKKVRGFASSAGFTKTQTDLLVQSVLALINKDGQLPKGVRTQYSTPGLAQAISGLSIYLNQLAGIPSKLSTTIQENITRNFLGGTPIKPAQGAMFAQGGFVGWAGQRPIVAGDGSYNTMFGGGAEIVSARGVMPLSNRHLQTMAAFQAREMVKYLGATGPTINLHFHAPVYGLPDFQRQVETVVYDELRPLLR